MSKRQYAQDTILNYTTPVETVKFKTMKEAQSYYSSVKASDVYTSTSKVHVKFDNNVFNIQIAGHRAKNIPLDRVGFETLLKFAGVPKRSWADKIEPDHAEYDVNRRMQYFLDAGMLLRVRDGKIHGVLSDSYLPIMHKDVVDKAIERYPMLATSKLGVIVDSGRILRLSSTFGNQKIQIGKDDISNPGINIIHSETGYSALSLNLMLFRIVCSNGLIVGKNMKNDYMIHRGGGGEDAFLQKYINGLEELSKHIPALSDLLKLSSNIDLSKHLSKFEPEIRRVFGNEFYDQVLMKEFEQVNSVYSAANIITAKVHDFSPEKRVDAERVAGNMLLALQN